MEVTTKNAKETFDLGKKIGSEMKGGEVLALIGELGAGKTTFVQGIADGIGIKDKIVSPTFILMRNYKGVRLNLYHLDLYRLEGDLRSHLFNLGVDEVFNDKQNVTVVEWADKLPDIFPKNVVWVEIKSIDQNTRIINIKK